MISAKGLPITFASVAREAKVSMSYLYKEPDLSARIQSLRGTGRHKTTSHSHGTRATRSRA